MSKKLLLITQVFYPDQVSSAGLLTDLCAELRKKNIEVEVWCAQPSYDTRIRQPKKKMHQGINIRYLTSTNLSKDKVIGRLLNYLSFTMSVLYKLLFSKMPRLVLTSTNPPFIGYLIALIIPLRRKKLIYLVQDVFPDGLVRLGSLSKYNPIVVIGNFGNRLILKVSTKVILIGRDMLDWANQKFPKHDNKLTYIPIWLNEELVHPVSFDENPFVKENPFINNFTVQYSGNMGLWNNLQPIAEVCSDPEMGTTNFLFIGGGIKKQELIKNIKTEGRNVFFFKFQPAHKIKYSLTACHVALVSLGNKLEGMAVPSKIMGILAAGVPVIAMVPLGSEIARIVSEENCGIVIPPDNSFALKNAIIWMKNNEKDRITMGKNGRKAYEQKYTTRNIVSRYTELFTKI